ncbi:MAG: hypothetical protein SNJ57_20415, partial [Cyanobacteriota bacterium]
SSKTQQQEQTAPIAEAELKARLSAQIEFLIIFLLIVGCDLAYSWFTVCRASWTDRAIDLELACKAEFSCAQRVKTQSLTGLFKQLLG